MTSLNFKLTDSSLQRDEILSINNEYMSWVPERMKAPRDHPESFLFACNYASWASARLRNVRR
jgi:hypothetical protein